MTTAVTTRPPGVLAEGALYLGDNGRIMCAATHCAGMTAQASGHDLSGQRVSRVTVDDVAEWATYNLGPMRCMCAESPRDSCGGVTLTAIAGPDGWPLSW
jgi:hypothetical protein